MRNVSLFVEDYMQQQVIGALVERLAQEHEIEIRCGWRNVRRGRGKVVTELKDYLRDLGKQSEPYPDLIIAATDANCKGLHEWQRELGRRIKLDPPAPIIYAIPDPHIERWLLLDGAAVKRVLGVGCDAPDKKCKKAHYKRRLPEAVIPTDNPIIIGTADFTEGIVWEINIDRVSRADRSFKHFIDALRTIFRKWQS